MAGEHRWIFTREEIANTPSRKCGIDSEKELNYRQQAANLIQDMGQRLSVSQLCINTAIVYMHRFYMFHSFTKFHRNAIASAGLFLAAKVEEQPRKLEHVIKVCHMLLNTKGGGQLDVKSEQYLAEAHDLVSNENVLLQTLGFDITVDHPHGHVVRTCTLVKASKDLAQTSYFLATNSLHLTQMCLIYKPTVVACVCMHLACKWSDYQIPRSSEGKEWFSYVDREVTSELLEELTGEFLAILDRCPSKLKRKILNWKAGGREDQMGGGSPSMGMSAPPPPPPPDRHRHRPAPSATQSSANQEHHAKQHGAPPPSSEGMRRVQTEPANLVNTSSITPKEYLQRHQKKKVDDGRERHHHHGLPQHGGTKHDFPDGAPVRRPHDPNAPHGHHRRPSSSQSSQHKRHPSQSHSAPDAKKPTVEGEQPPPPPPPPVPTQEPKERSNIFDKMQLETSNTSTPEPLLDHQSIKESLEIDLMDMSKDASLPTPAKKDMNSLKSSSSIIPKSSNPREKHPPSISKMQDPSQILSNLKTQGASQALSLSVGAADSKEKVVAGSFKHFPDKSEKLDKEAEQIRRPLPQTHRERHPHSSHRKPSGPKSVQKPIADMTAFEKALVMSTPKETKSGLASPTKPMLSSPPSRSNLMSPNQESKDSQEPTTPKEQRIPVERGMLVSSERKQRNRLPSISVEDRTLLESRRGSSPKIILERFDSSDSDTNTSKDNGTKISPKGTPLVKKEPGVNPSELSMRVKREESSKMDSILETDVINEAQTMKVNFSVLEHIKTEGHPNEHSQEQRFSSSIKIESSHSNGRHRHEAHGPPVRKDANVKQEPDVNVKRETSLSFPNELVMKAEPIRPKLLDDIKEPGELSMSPSDYAAGDSASTRFNLSTDLNESVPNFRKKELEAAGLLIEPKVKDSPSSGSLKVTINKTVMSNSPMSDKDVRKEKKEKHRDKDREHRHRDKKHKKHKHHKRSHSPNSGRSHHTSREEPKLEEPTQYPIKKLKITFGSNPGSGSDSERITNVISTDDHKQLPGTTAEASGLKIHFNKDLSGQYISNSSHHKYKKDKDRDRDREKSRKRNRSPSSRSHEGNNPSKISKSESMSTKNLMEYPDPQALQEAKMSVDKAIALLSKNMEAQMGSDSNTLGNMPPLPSGQPQKPPPPPTDLPPVLPPPNPPL